MDLRAQASLLMSLDAPRDLEFTIRIRALLSRKAPRQSVWLEANSCRLARVDYDLRTGPATRTLSGRIPRSCLETGSNLQFTLRTDRASSPSEIGINGDSRPLGIGVESLVFHDAGTAVTAP